MWEIVVKLFVGIVIFLLGFSFIEDAIRNLSGRSFKLYLKRQTSNPIKAVIGGTVVTAILQSSSIVNFLVLSFVGAGVLKIPNALAVMLGANLGTTLDSWVIALIGFKVNLELFSLPMIAIGGMIMLLTPGSKSVYFWSRFIAGLGFLFFGLDFIKNGVSELFTTFDLGSLKNLPLVVYVVFGLISTMITQSSSVTIALTLAALHENGISLISAMAVVLGSEVGTTIKLILAAWSGPAVKKKVAYGNLIFNGVTLILSFVFIRFYFLIITDWIGIKDPLMALVLFQTMINFVCILLFLPVLNKLGDWLSRHISSKEDKTDIIHKVKVTDGDFAHDAVEQETGLFMQTVLEFFKNVFEISDESSRMVGNSGQNHFDRSQWYAHIKHIHGDLRQYIFQLRKLTDEPEKLSRLEQLQESSREAMYACKNLKDSFPDIDLFRNSSNDFKYKAYLESKSRMELLCQQLLGQLQSKSSASILEFAAKQVNQLELEYQKRVTLHYHSEATIKLSEDEFSTLINFDREIYTASKYLVVMLIVYFRTDFFVDSEW